MKTYWRRLQCKIFLSSKTSWRHSSKTSCKHVLKMSWKTSWKRLGRRLEDFSGRRIANTSWRRLGRRKALRWRRLQDVLKTSWKTRNACWHKMFSSIYVLYPGRRSLVLIEWKIQMQLRKAKCAKDLTFQRAASLSPKKRHRENRKVNSLNQKTWN